MDCQTRLRDQRSDFGRGDVRSRSFFDALASCSRGSGVLFGLLAAAATAAGCSAIPDPKVTIHSFPKDVYVKEPKRPYRKIGLVRTKVEYMTLNANWDEDRLCKNYFNKAASDLLKRAKEKGADAVVDVRSVVFLIDGRAESYPKPECSDDGSEGQVLAQGYAVKWGAEKDPELRALEKDWESGKLEAVPAKLSDSTKRARRASKPAPVAPASEDDDETALASGPEAEASEAVPSKRSRAPASGESAGFEADAEADVEADAEADTEIAPVPARKAPKRAAKRAAAKRAEEFEAVEEGLSYDEAPAAPRRKPASVSRPKPAPARDPEFDGDGIEDAPRRPAARVPRPQDMSFGFGD